MTTRRCGTRRGFTLVEILAVMAVIAILAGLALGVAQIINSKKERARALVDLGHLSDALNDYRFRKGHYPAYNGDISLPAFDAYRRDLTNGVPDLNFTDPWGYGYLYSNLVPLAFRLTSRGPNPDDLTDDISEGSL